MVVTNNSVQAINTALLDFDKKISVLTTLAESNQRHWQSIVESINEILVDIQSLDTRVAALETLVADTDGMSVLDVEEPTVTTDTTGEETE